MNKQELTIVVLLFALLLGWGYFTRKNVPPPAPPAPEQAERVETVGAAEQPDVEVPSVGQDSISANMAEPVSESPVVTAPVEPGRPEEYFYLRSAVAGITLSSRGGSIVGAELNEFKATTDEDSGPLTLDFRSKPALSLEGLAGLTVSNHYELSGSEDGRNAVARIADPQGLSLERSFVFKDGYQLDVTDVFVNSGRDPITLPVHGVNLGPMQAVETKAKMRGISYLGIDTLAAHGGENVKHWRKNLPGLFGSQGSRFSCARKDYSWMKPNASSRIGQPVQWAAVKNKFFAQIVSLENEDVGVDCEISVDRDVEVSGALSLSSVCATIQSREVVLKPGETFKRSLHYYVGPKQYSLLRDLGHHKDEVMEFGWMAWLCKPLLMTLTWIHDFMPNYGVAIIILTAIIRIVFWPVTHKSTESMKKMQKVQPLVTAIREKHKDNPQRMNQEVMALYKEHKVNPMAGCLPMLVQIPVFIAFFTVLRSAVELRFADFLWIRDLSEPEGLLAGMIPVVGSLNILPLFMTATMILQQNLTPTAGDPQQKKMMMFMPVVMLFIFYGMPSALVLYWSTSQCLSIAQLLIQRRKRGEE